MADNDGVKLTTPTIRVVPREGDEYLVQAENPDLVAYDLTAFKHKWPPMDKAPFVWLTFLAWHASRRTGVIPTELGYEAFRDSTREVSAANADAAADAVTPTEPVAATDY